MSMSKGENFPYTFRAMIYKVGINWCVDVPATVTDKLTIKKGGIAIKGLINGYGFFKTLMPVKGSLYRLYVNTEMMKGGMTALGEVATFDIGPDMEKATVAYPVPQLLAERLDEHGLTLDFDNLAPSRKKDILKYLSYIKTEETLLRNIGKLIGQLERKERNIRIP